MNMRGTATLGLASVVWLSVVDSVTSETAARTRHGLRLVPGRSVRRSCVLSDTWLRDTFYG